MTPSGGTHTLQSGLKGRVGRLAAAGAVLAFAAAGSCATSARAQRGATDAWSRSPNTIVVGYRSPAQLARAVRGLPVRIVRTVPRLSVAELRVSDSPARIAGALAARRGIAYAQPLAPRTRNSQPALVTALQASYEWQFAAAREDTVPDWVLRAASGVTIAIVDTGADVRAPDLAAKAPRTYDLFTHGTDVADANGHGTFVASLAGGSVSNGEGISGFGGDVRLLIIRAGRRDGSFTDVDEAAGIVYAVDHGARIVNLSLGGPTTSKTEMRAIDYAYDHGVLLVAAAGNERKLGNPVEYPAALLQPFGSNGGDGKGLSVAASRQDGTSAPFSNSGTWISLAAPGVDVFGAVSSASSPLAFPREPLPGSSGLYGFASGTSFSTPEVAGAAALVWAANPTLTVASVTRILKETASGGGTWSPDLGYGTVDVGAAVAKAATQQGMSVTTERAGMVVHVVWRGPSEMTYRLSEVRDQGARQVLVDATTANDAWVRVAAGHTYRFTVGAFDATGTELVTSAPARVTVTAAATHKTARRKR
jgi:subtilase family protein/fervidolysin-like protein